MSQLKSMQDNQIDKGKLQMNVRSTIGIRPVENAKIAVSYTGGPGNTIEELSTDQSGQTQTMELSAPPLEYSLEPGMSQPYAEYTITVTADGYQPLDISGIEVLADVTAIQEVNLEPIEQPEEADSDIVIGPHTLYGDYPPKIAEAEIKPVNETGEIVLSRVVVPEYVIVHDGAPTDSTASDYYVRYSDYVKNVASSEIYATWEPEAIRANILAIMSFTLNRVYTEW